MSAPSQTRSRRVARAGFSVVELMCVVVIIACLARLAVPAVLHVRLRTLASAYRNDTRVFAEAFLRYGHEKGVFPASSTTAGVLPTEMRGYINDAQWSRKTPLGGNYAWDATVIESEAESSSPGNSANKGKGNAYAKGRGNSSSGASSAGGGTGRSILVSNSTLTIAQHTSVDELIDDGDLATGNYQVSDAGFTVVFYIGN